MRKLVSSWLALVPSQKKQKPWSERSLHHRVIPQPVPASSERPQTERSPCVKPVLTHPLDPTADHNFHLFSPFLSTISSILLFYYFLLLHVHKLKFSQVLKDVKIISTHTHTDPSILDLEFPSLFLAYECVLSPWQGPEIGLKLARAKNQGVPRSSSWEARGGDGADGAELLGSHRIHGLSSLSISPLCFLLTVNSIKAGALPVEGKAAQATSSRIVISKERSSPPPGIHVSNLRETGAPGPFMGGRHWIWLLLCLKLLPGFPTSTHSIGWKPVHSATGWPCHHLCTSSSFLQSPHPQHAHMGNFCSHNSRPTSAPPALRKHCQALQGAFCSASSSPAAPHTFPCTLLRQQHSSGNAAIYLSVSPSKLQIPCLYLINL